MGQPAVPGRQPDVEDPPTRRVFRVVGPRLVGGASKGQLVTLEVTEAQANALIEAGHVEPATPGRAPATNKEGVTRG